MKKTSRAGVSDTRAGLQPAGLYSSAGLFKKGFQDFHPLDASPYLLFDASKSMVGTLENPTLDLDPSKQETLDVITATRSGVATYTDADGIIQQAAPDTVRVDYVDGVPMILVEPSATNLLPYSEDFSNSAWTKFGAGTGVAPTVTPNYGTSPDGTVSASRVQFNKGSGTTIGDQSVIFDSAQTSSGATTAKSVYLKSNTTEAYEMVIYETTDASGTNVKKITVTPDWQRFDVYGAISSITTGITIGLREISVSGLSNTADVLVWGAQLEAGSVATSYIPTSGSTVTRQADNLVISGSDFTDFFNSGGDGTFYAEFTTRTITGEQVYVLAGHSNTQRYMYSNTDGALLKTFDGYSDDFGGDIQTTLNRASISYNSNSKKCSVNGASDVTHVGTGDLQDSTRLSIGQSWSDQNHLNGHIKRLIYWPLHSDSL